jgi:uncharacterized protein YkwD
MPNGKKDYMKTSSTYLVLVIAAAALTACGGGGSAAPTTAAAAGAASPAPVAVPAAPPTYAAGTEVAQAFALLNSERVACGFGALRQNVKLDQAADAHAKFLVENGLQYSHYEVAGLPRFTGVQEQDRAAAAGYAEPVGAVLTGSVGTLALSQALTIEKQVRSLLAAPFHMLGALDDYAEAGVGFASNVTGTKETKALNVTLGKPGNSSLIAAEIYTYPCAGSSGVNPVLVTETPSPVPTNLSQDASRYGTPISVMLKRGQVLALTSATIAPASGGPAVATTIVDRSNTPQLSLMRSDGAYVLPMSPLLPSTGYTVQLIGTNNGAAFTKSFTFSTGQ